MCATAISYLSSAFYRISNVYTECDSFVNVIIILFCDQVQYKLLHLLRYHYWRHWTQVWVPGQ